jgi:hypothetical protein
LDFKNVPFIFDRLHVDVEKRDYELFVKDIETITDNSGLRDFILIFGDFNLPKVKWKVDEESGSMIPLNVTSDLESDLIGRLFGCDLDQINERPIENGTFLDRVFTNVPVDMAVGVAETPLLKLNRHQKAYEIEMQISSCKFEAMEGGVKQYRFKLADCVAIVDELGAAFYRVDGSTNAWTILQDGLELL